MHIMNAMRTIHTMLLMSRFGWSKSRSHISCTDFILHHFTEAVDRCPPSISIDLDPIRSYEDGSFRGLILRVFVDCLDFLDSDELNDFQMMIIEDKLSYILEPLAIDINELKIESIDYCKNVVIENPAHRQLYMELWGKTFKQFNGATRIFEKNRKPTLKSLKKSKKSKKPKEASRTANTLYWKCKDWYNVQLYDKETERKDKGKPIRSYERGVIRLEYQIRTEHIKYWKKLGRPRDFDTWTDGDLRAKYLSETERLFFRGDFYSLPCAKTRLNKAVRAGTITQTLADNIYQFMVDISRSDMDYAVGKRSQTTAKKYIEILSEIGVNPIPIPKNKGISFLENPFGDFYKGGCKS